MTIISICAVYDATANLYGSPFSATNKHVAIRQFQAELAAPEAVGPMQTHPQDFKLVELGLYDNTHGRFQLHENPEFLYQGSAKSDTV